MVAADVLRGDMALSHWDYTPDGFLLDVRESVELAVEDLPDAVNIPLGELRQRLGELPRHQEIRVVCRSGQRAYSAARVLSQKGSTPASSPEECSRTDPGAGRTRDAYGTRVMRGLTN